MPALFLVGFFLIGCQQFAYAQGLVTDCTDPFACGFEQMMTVVRNIVNFAFLIAAPLAAIAFMWAGILYLTAAGNESQIKKAHSIFSKVLIGFIIVLAAWLIVSVIFKALVNPNASLLG